MLRHKVVTVRFRRLHFATIDLDVDPERGSRQLGRCESIFRLVQVNNHRSMCMKNYKEMNSATSDAPLTQAAPSPLPPCPNSFVQ